jgi:N utilization substance protein B
VGKRSTSRRVAMQALYQAALSGISIDDALKNIFSAENFIPETQDFAKKLATGSWQEAKKLDTIISSFAKDWPLERIGRVDRSILQLALYELILGETPASVVVDEAVELAKKYCGAEAAKFINGILGAYLKKKD